MLLPYNVISQIFVLRCGLCDLLWAREDERGQSVVSDLDDWWVMTLPPVINPLSPGGFSKQIAPL